LDQASKRIDSQPPTHIGVEARLRLTFGEAYESLGLLQPAHQQLQRAVELFQRSGRQNSSESAKAQAHLGQVLDKQGKAELAEPLLREALRIQRTLDG